MAPKIKIVSITQNAFIFCRYTLAMLLWLSFFTKNYSYLLLVTIILIFSAILKIQKAPLVWLYTNTINKMFPGKEVMIEENGMRFAHTVGAIFGILSLIFITMSPSFGQAFLFIFCLVKTISATGFCPATKLYSCMSGGGSCCRFIKNDF